MLWSERDSEAHRALPSSSWAHNANVNLGHNKFVSVDGDAHDDDVCVLSISYDIVIHGLCDVSFVLGEFASSMVNVSSLSRVPPILCRETQSPYISTNHVATALH